MATNLLSTADAVDQASGPVIVTAGNPITIHLKDANNTALMAIEKSDDAAAWQPTQINITAADPGRTLVGAGTYRAVRKAGTCGVFYD